MTAPASRLHEQLPLLGRQRALPSDHADAHRLILRSFATAGLPPPAEEFGMAGPAILQRLASDDLIVLDPDGRIVGAYPFTLEDTPHRMRVDGHDVGAMCSLDAVTVAPVFDTRVSIASTCAVSGRDIRIEQRGDEILTVSSDDIRVGVRWQAPDGCAAHSMCRDMVFLADSALARSWATGIDADVFDLEAAVEFGVSFFGPLLSTD